MVLAAARDAPKFPSWGQWATSSWLIITISCTIAMACCQFLGKPPETICPGEHRSLTLDARKAVTKRLAACCLEANKEAKLVERKSCLILRLATWEEEWSIWRLSPSLDNHWQEIILQNFHRWREGVTCYKQKQHSQLWQSSWNWSCGGLISSHVDFLFKIELVFSSRLVCSCVILRQPVSSSLSVVSVVKLGLPR